MLVAIIAAFQGVAVPDTLTLARAQEHASRMRGRVVSARASVDLARADARRNSVIPNPLVQFESSGQAPTRTLQATQPLSWLPGFAASRAAGSAAVRAAAADSVWTMAQMARDVRIALYSTVAADEMLRLIREHRAAADSMLGLADRRVALGDISELERDQVAQEAAIVRLLEQRAIGDARVARLELGRALGSRVAPEVVIPARLEDHLPAADQQTAWTSTTPEGVGDLPLVALALEDSAAAASRLAVARWRRLPVPALLGKWEWGGPGVPRNNIIGFSLPLPLWNFGQHDVSLARAEAMVSSGVAFEARLEGVRRLEEGRVRFEESGARAQEARERLFPVSRQLRSGAVRLFESGRSGILSVFEAFRRERETAMTMVQELLAYQVARAELAALLGREP